LKERFEELVKRIPELKKYFATVSHGVPLTIDLSTARTDEEIVFNGVMDSLFVESNTGTLTFKLNDVTSDEFEAKPGTSLERQQFWRLYITNAAQSGKVCKILVGGAASFMMRGPGSLYLLDANGVTINPAKEDGNLASILGQLDIKISALRDALRGTNTKDFSTLETELDKKPDEATTPNAYNVAITTADTEYSQALPDGTKALEFWARESNDIRFAFETGKVATPTAPYFTLKAGEKYYKERLNLTGKTLYLASSTVTTNIEIIAWT